jgi:hypothetical protein
MPPAAGPSSSVPTRSASSSPGSMHPQDGRTMPAPSTPRQVRLQLEQVLGHHAILMVRLMRGTVDGEDQFVDAADEAVGRNTGELVQTIRSVYGQQAATRFTQLWNAHVAGLQRYAQAVADDDDAAKQAAVGQLDTYSDQYGQYVSGLTDGRLVADQVADDVRMHVQHLVDATDAYAAADFGSAYEDERTAYGAMFSTGTAMSAAALGPPGELPAGFDSPPARLRSALGQLLGEHAELAFDATRAVVTGSPSAAAAAAALDENTKDVIAALRGALGPAAASKLGAVWADHIDALVSFAVAVADRDAVAQSRARAQLDEFPARLGAPLLAVAAGRVKGQVVLDALHEHDEQLLQQVTAYAARDYPTAHEIAYDGYEHMFAIAGPLASALEGNAAAQAPHGGAATGGGGLAAP